MRSAIGLCCFATLTAGVCAQQDAPESQTTGEQNRSPRAIEILRRVDEACRNVKAISYRGKYTATGAPANQSPAGSYRTVQRGEWDSPSFQHWTEFTYSLPNSEESRHVTIGSDGHIFYMIDPATKTVYEDIVPHVLGQPYQLLRRMWMREFVFPRPFGDELNATVIRFDGTTVVGDEECYRIYVDYSGNPERSTWFFSTSDYLPRRVDRDLPHMGGASQVVVYDVVVDPGIDETLFKSQAPDGFSRTDEFAP